MFRNLLAILVLTLIIPLAACSGGRGMPIISTAQDVDQAEATAVITCPEGRVNTHIKTVGHVSVVVTAHCDS